MSALIDRLQASPLTTFLSENAYAFPLLEIAHVLSFSLVLGTIFVIDLRLTGLGWRRWGARALLDDLVPVTIWAFGFTALSGVFLFASQPQAYVAAWPFRLKLVLLALAGANALGFHLLGADKVPAEAGARLPIVARVSGGASLLLWTLILATGRFIGFVIVH